MPSTSNRSAAHTLRCRNQRYLPGLDVAYRVDPLSADDLGRQCSHSGCLRQSRGFQAVETARFKQSSVRHVGTRINRRRDDNALTRLHSSRHQGILSTCIQGKHAHSAETFLTISEGSHRQGWDDTIAEGIDTSPKLTAQQE